MTTHDDEQAAAELRAEQAARKLAKSRGREATKRAKQRGELKRMPPTGKAALAAIARGYW